MSALHYTQITFYIAIHININNMPASRKRSKGKNRKAKKEEIEKEKMRNLWQRWIVNDECDHGCTVEVPNDHPVLLFMDTLFNNAEKVGISKTLSDTFQNHPEVWSNSDHRTLAGNIMTCMGANMLLSKDDPFNPYQTLYVANVIVALTCYEGRGAQTILCNQNAAQKMNRLHPYCRGSRRDALKFFRKRTTCKCLKEMHLEARKSSQKTGVCYGCLKEYERAAMLVCSRCNVNVYCSRECQVANWPKHMRQCDIYVKANKTG